MGELIPPTSQRRDVGHPFSWLLEGKDVYKRQVEKQVGRGGSMLRWKALFVIALSVSLFAGTSAMKAQVEVGIGIAPICPYGYYDYAPYQCSPYGYYCLLYTSRCV